MMIKFILILFPNNMYETLPSYRVTKKIKLKGRKKVSTPIKIDLSLCYLNRDKKNSPIYK
jgi:hypothetical protein